MIGSLLWLIRSAAISAVLDGTEKIIKKALDNAEADITPNPPPASPGSPAIARKASATTCTGAEHPESGPSGGRTCSPTTAASGSPKTRTRGPATCSTS
jgi:hypothetical protein